MWHFKANAQTIAIHNFNFNLINHEIEIVHVNKNYVLKSYKLMDLNLFSMNIHITYIELERLLQLKK